MDAMLDRPWVMLSAGAAMEAFRRILTYAFRAGASGYLAGRAIWWPAAQEYPNWERFRARVREEGLPYVKQVQALLATPRQAVDVQAGLRGRGHARQRRSRLHQHLSG